MTTISWLTTYSKINILCFLGKEYYNNPNDTEYHIRFKRQDMEKTYAKVYNLYKNTVIHRNHYDEGDSFYYCINRCVYSDDSNNVSYPHNKRYTVVCTTTNQKMPSTKSNTIIFVNYPSNTKLHENFTYPRYETIQSTKQWI